MTNNWKYALLVAAMFPTAAAFAQSGDQGRKAVDLGRYQEAKSIYKSQLNNKNADNAYFGLGDVYLRSENVDSAAYYFNQGLAKNSKSAINMVGLGKVEMAKGNRAGAEKHFADAMKRGKKDSHVLASIGEAYLMAPEATEQDYNKAIEYLKQAVERDKNNAEAYLLMGDAYLKLGNGGQAMTSYDNAIRINDKSPKAHLRRGQLYTSSRNYNEAEEAYKKAIELDPNYAPAYSDLGELYYFAGQYDRALSTFKQFVDMSENTPATRAKYASFLFLTKDYEGTLREVQEVLKTEPNNKTMNRLLAYSYLELGKPEEALKAMENYLSKVDQNSLIASDYEYYGRILARNNQPAKAVENLEKAIALEPTKPELYYDLANMYAREKQFDKAVEVYNRKQEKLGASNTDYFHLGNAYMMAEQFEKADETYKKITDANPTYAYAHLWRARAQSNLDPETEQGLAKPHYEEFIKLTNGEKEKYKKELIEANTYLGYYYYLKGERDNAIKHWTEVKTLDPTNTQAETALAEINKTPSQKKRR
ncbi:MULTISPECIES: tetratricopeptide repeat protein [Pontibacter]|uniref:Tetratricopeptide repeat-containing protein n=1 Tax=Pontibacter lucknowensis TaxID=1077936 RepID=A0A1N7BAV4_9BACT|nr:MULTISPECIES: tetratricopeptide repeat protein [Pontibacter]EJF10060.1 TPR repeat-containing protein [Pontibacter sp. BAB1700]SIR48323.1 Tetratricopeptide repeat-containing protein [Pontibacter lucknowensis]